MGLFNDRLKNSENKTQVPVWFMRQAGRYHSHYQNIKKDSDFMSMCKDPKMACEITMGPIRDFNFDAAILFSDLLFPLEQLGLGLTYNPGPILKFKLETLSDLKKCQITEPSQSYYKFQKQATELLRSELPKTKSLLGFVGAPWTLYTYAVEGSHAGNLTSSKKGFYDGRFKGFCEMLIPELLVEMSLQAQGGADAICLFDTAVGELTFVDFKEFILPVLRSVTSQFKKIHPDKKIVYYSKLTHLNYLQEIQDENIDVLGIDWRMSLPECLKTLGSDYMIQGNFDPSYLHYDWPILEKKLEQFWAPLKDSSLPLDKWIMGLGHGVLQQTPEVNVRKSVEFIHKNFVY
ncbi:MAG: uroporphyrinogen decarboxylase [Bacteriovoracaceae bacterium]|nr:uroporphyrinogen decarboxylase [Bacteriovoracaceae bacterium]